MTTEEVAEQLGVSAARVRQFVSEGRLSAEREGRSLLFESSDVEAFASQERSTGRPPSKARPGADDAGAGRGPATLFETPAAAPKPAAAPAGEPSQRSGGSDLQRENARLVTENRQLRSELEQVRTLAAALKSGTESLGQVSQALQQTLGASARQAGSGRS